MTIHLRRNYEPERQFEKRNALISQIKLHWKEISLQNLENLTSSMQNESFSKIHYPYLHHWETKIQNSPLIFKLVNRINHICKKKELIFCWVPRHIGIHGNVKANIAAKKIFKNENFKFENPFYKLQSNYEIIDSKQVTRVMELSSKEQTLQNETHSREWDHGLRLSGKEEVALSRIAIFISLTHFS